MKKIRYNSWIARTILFPGFSTITLAAFVCTTYKSKEEMPQRVRNHECVHARQWVEIAFVLGAVIWLLTLLPNISPFWYLLAFLGFYILYVVEYLVRLVINGKEAYKHISFEAEAREAESDETYLENGDYFQWINYLFKK